MSTNSTLILCQGDQGRLWGLRTPKHLVNFCGAPLLERTISLIKKNGADSIIINASMEEPWRTFGAEHDLAIHAEPQKKPNQDFLDVIQHFRSTWNENGPTYFLYGDVVWSERMLAELYKHRQSEIFFATRFSPTPATNTWRAEIFGFRFLPTYHKRLDEMLASREMSPYHRARDVWDLFHWTMDSRDNLPGEPEFLDAGSDDYTLDIDYPGDLENLPILEMMAKEESLENAAKEKTDA